MKTIKKIVTLIAVILVSGMYAQTDNKQTATETKINKFTVKSEKGAINYVVKVDTKSTGYVKMDDLSKKEETRVKSPANVTTTISVDADGDPFYDNAFTLTYKSYEDNPVTVVPTPSGFNINVAGEVLQYDFIEKVCEVPEGCPVKVNMISVTNE